MSTYHEIANQNQGGLAAAADEVLYFSAGINTLCSLNLKTGNVTFVCEDPVCPHDYDCASANKTFLQTSGNRLFAHGYSEVRDGTVTRYSSFGEIAGGKYHKILEKDSNIYLPSIAGGKILAEINNQILIIDLTTGKTVNSFDFPYTLSLSQLYSADKAVYFVNGLGLLNKIDIASGETVQISDEKLSDTLPYNDCIYFISIKDKSLCRMRSDGTEAEKIRENCETYNILNGTIYYSKTSSDGVFTVSPGGTEKKICDLKGITGIYIFEKQDILLCTSYDFESVYISDLEGNNMYIPKVPEQIVLDG